MKLKIVSISENTVQYHILCPGCDQEHMFNNKRWTCNNDVNKPTISPSLLLTGTRFNGPFICHSFITNGNIQYLDDCTHFLKGQTVTLPDYPDHEAN